MPRADKAAAWKHDLSPIVLDRLRRIIPSLDGHYHRLDKAPAAEWGQKLARYAAFQRLRRQLGESETDHRARQARWLCRRRAFERENRELSDDIKSAWPHDSDNGAEIPLGTWIASSEQVTGSDLADFISVSATGRALVFDIASDKELLMGRISELIDKERKAAGIAPAVRRGPTSSAKTKTAAIHSEQREFLRAIRDHCIVRLIPFASRSGTTTRPLCNRAP